MFNAKCKLITALMVIAVVGMAAVSAEAQTRLALEAGALLPTGNLKDGAEVSPFFGGRMEIQRTNALGQVAVLSYIVRAGYSPLKVKSEVKTVLEAAGLSTSSWLFTGGAGVRVYAAQSPLFFSAGANYLFIEQGGDGNSGVEGMLGIGFSKGVTTIIGVEARGHFASVQNTDNFSYFTIVGTVGLPF